MSNGATFIQRQTTERASERASFHATTFYATALALAARTPELVERVKKSQGTAIRREKHVVT